MNKVDIDALKKILKADFTRNAFSSCNCGTPVKYCAPDVKDIPYKKK